MGSVLLGVVARRRSDKSGVKSDKVELGECVFRTKEHHLNETPPLGIRYSSTSLKQSTINALNIGKLARLGERKVGDEQQQVNLKVSHVNVAYLGPGECRN